MKIIITESQLQNVYDEFLTYQMGDLKKYTDVRRRNRFGYDKYDGHIFWINEKGDVMIEKDTLNRYWVSRDVIERFTNFFGFEYALDLLLVLNELKKWIEKHLNIDNPKVMSAHYRDWERWQNLEVKP